MGARTATVYRTGLQNPFFVSMGTRTPMVYRTGGLQNPSLESIGASRHPQCKDWFLLTICIVKVVGVSHVSLSVTWNIFKFKVTGVLKCVYFVVVLSSICSSLGTFVCFDSSFQKDGSHFCSDSTLGAIQSRDERTEIQKKLILWKCARISASHGRGRRVEKEGENSGADR